jgi:hypothetical protein
MGSRIAKLENALKSQYNIFMTEIAALKEENGLMKSQIRQLLQDTEKSNGNPKPRSPKKI